MKRSFGLGAYLGVLLVLGGLYDMYGGLLWIPMLIALLPFAAVGAGYLYGKITGASGGMDVDTAVSKGLDYRDGFDPDEEYNDE